MRITTRLVIIVTLVAVTLGMVAIVTAPAHESGHIYLVERRPTTDELCSVSANRVWRYYNISGTHADDNDMWASRHVSGNSWLVRLYASKANLANTDLVHVETYIRTLTC